MKKSLTKKEFDKYLSHSKGLNVIVSVTRECVLKCKYCYARSDEPQTRNRILPIELLEKLIRESFETRHEKIKFEWTGGEALLANQDFYDKALYFQKRYCAGKPFDNAMQTSGGLYNEERYDHLLANGFSISLTIDGTKFHHDSQRPLCNGSQSFDTVFKSFKYLKEKQGECGVLCTVTRPMAASSTEIFDFYSSVGIKDWLSNPYIFDPNKPVKEERLGINEDEFADYFISQYDHWLRKNDTSILPGFVLSISEDLAAVSNFSGCTRGGKCLTNFINIDPDGDAYNCPKFLGYAEHKLGNISESSVSELISSDNPRMRRYLCERRTAFNRCLKNGCSFFSICNGGCPYSSLLKGGDGRISHEDIFCAGKKRLFEHINEKLKRHKIATIAL